MDRKPLTPVEYFRRDLHLNRKAMEALGHSPKWVDDADLASGDEVDVDGQAVTANTSVAVDEGLR